MALDWRTKRKLLYIGIPVCIVVITVVSLMIKAYATPSCTDGRMNGDEKGIDCEGSCPQVCLQRTLPLSVEWSDFEESYPGAYNAVGIVKNSNKDLIAKNVETTLTIWNGSTKIDQFKKTISIPPDQSVGVFHDGIKTSSIPSRVTLEVEPPQAWEQNDLPRIDFVDAQFSDTENVPKLSVSLKNATNSDAENVEVIVALVDGKGNSDHFSRTIIPQFPRKSNQMAYYTWNLPFVYNKNTCSEPFSAVLLIDRSGSMNADSVDPPQPLNDVLDSAKRFVSAVGSQGSMGLVTFATQARTDLPLTNIYNKLISSLDAVSILPEDEEGYTNIGDAFIQAQQLLSSITGPKYTVLLTDGKPNWPLQPTGQEYAREQADQLRASGVELYAIGLGSGIDQGTLESILQSQKNVFIAPQPEQLDSIFESIGQRVCVRSPYRVEIYPNILYGQQE